MKPELIIYKTLKEFPQFDRAAGVLKRGYEIYPEEILEQAFIDFYHESWEMPEHFILKLASLDKEKDITPMPSPEKSEISKMIEAGLVTNMLSHRKYTREEVFPGGTIDQKIILMMVNLGYLYNNLQKQII